MIKYEINLKIMNCEKIQSVTSHNLYSPSPCHKLSHFLRPLPPWSVTYFMDGPQLWPGLLTNVWDTYIDPSKFNTVNYLYELIIELYVKW